MSDLVALFYNAASHQWPDAYRHSSAHNSDA
ncbi:hypothetical protein MED222_05535 [Vibrio sp. MED222]|nr:hypothetical protein MED222_05535 [Vibrio sp. MED222]